MKITLSSLIKKYSYLIFLSLFLLSSCSKKAPIQTRRYLIINAEKLGMIESSKKSYNANVSEGYRYHKIFKNYQGKSAYKIKKIPKNNPLPTKKIHNDNYNNLKPITKETSTMAAPTPKVVPEQLHNKKSKINHQDNLVTSSNLNTDAFKLEESKTININNNSNIAEILEINKSKSEITLPATLSTEQKILEKDNLENEIKILPPLSSLFESEEDLSFISAAESNIKGELESQDGDFFIDDKHLFKLAFTEPKQQEHFAHDYLIAENSLFINNFSMLASYSNSY